MGTVENITGKKFCPKCGKTLEGNEYLNGECNVDECVNMVSARKASSAHTPGQWESTKQVSHDGALQYGIYSPKNMHVFCTVTGEHAEAKARLIAAAPSLLEACQYLLETCEDEIGEQSDSALRTLRKAIAKAEGR